MPVGPLAQFMPGVELASNAPMSYSIPSGSGLAVNVAGNLGDGYTLVYGWETGCDMEIASSRVGEPGVGVSKIAVYPGNGVIQDLMPRASLQPDGRPIGRPNSRRRKPPLAVFAVFQKA